MNSKNKNRIYKIITEEICNKYDGAKEFVDNRIKEICFQDGILINEVRTWFKVNLFLLFSIFFVLKVNLQMLLCVW